MKDICDDKERLAVAEFRSKLGDLNLSGDKNSDSYLIRWLKARDFNVGKAEEMLRKSLRWREEHKIDDILSWKAPPVYSRFYPVELCGYDKSGCPIVVIPLKYFDIKKFLQCDKAEYRLFGIQNLERVLHAMKARSTVDKPVTEFVALYDLEGLDLRAFMNKQHLIFMQESTAFVDEQYPGPYIRKAYCLYSPKVFSMIFSMVKHIVPKRTIERYEIYGSNKEKWAHKLLEHIEADQLPPRFGGTNVHFEKNAFAHCQVPSESTSANLPIDGGYHIVTVGARKKLQIAKEIGIPNSMLSWTFKVEGYDIGFSILYEAEEVFAYQRVPADQLQQSSINCIKPGRYTFVFDNSFSKLRSKTLHYSLTIISSSANTCDVVVGPTSSRTS